jgi:HemY protein
MKYLISFFLIVLVAVSAGLLAHQDAGYVLFGRGYYTLEMSLSLFIVLLIFSFFSGYLLLRFIIRTWGLPDHLKHWRLSKQSKKSRQLSLLGLINLSQGQWKKAERLLTRSVKNSDMPLLNYLSAAKAAQKQNAPERRDHYLALAHKSMPEADFSVKLTQAELQAAYGQNEQALATLVHLNSISPKHPHIMVLLSQLYQQFKSWEDLKNLLPLLRKQKVFPVKQLLEMETQTYIELIRKINSKDDMAKLQNLWKDIPRDMKASSTVIEVYCAKLIQLESLDEAELILRTSLKKEWQSNLVKQYGLVKSSKPEKQLIFAESLSKDHDNHPVLLLTLGRLCMYNDLWGKARAYLEASIGSKESYEAYKELGLLMEYLNEQTLAARYFKKGLFLC